MPLMYKPVMKHFVLTIVSNFILLGHMTPSFAALDWEVTKVEIPMEIEWGGTAEDLVEGPNIIHFQNGKKLETKLYAVKVISTLSAKSRAPFLIISGRGCRGCDANISLYFHSPDDGPMKGEAYQPRYSYPGKEFYYMDGKLLSEHRFFFGECLSNMAEAAVWFQNDFDEGKEKKFVFIVYVDEDTLIEQSIEYDLPNIEDTLNLVREGKCHEIEGEDRTSEP